LLGALDGDDRSRQRFGLAVSGWAGLHAAAPGQQCGGNFANRRDAAQPRQNKGHIVSQVGDFWLARHPLSHRLQQILGQW
jgi:hypothetical protein